MKFILAFLVCAAISYVRAADAVDSERTARISLRQELADLETKIDAGTTFTATERRRFDKLVLKLAGLSKDN